MSIKSNLQSAAFTALHLIEKAEGKIAEDVEVWQAIAAQWIQEKGSQWWANPEPNFNVGNVTNGGSQNGFVDYPNLHSGVVGYVYGLLNTSFDKGKTKVYQNVIDEILGGTPESVCEALHNSPWCDPPYPLETLLNDLKEVRALTGTTQTQTEQIQGQIDSLNKQIESLQAEVKTLETEKETVSSEEFVTIGDTVKGIKLNSYWDIAQAIDGAGNQWPNLLRLNPGVNPAQLRVGMQIRVK